MNPDPGSQSNADPDPKLCPDLLDSESGSGSNEGPREV
jgi:hypothetical protein